MFPACRIETTCSDSSFQTLTAVASFLVDFPCGQLRWPRPKPGSLAPCAGKKVQDDHSHPVSKGARETFSHSVHISSFLSEESFQ
jgi:hypothetical protein